MSTLGITALARAPEERNGFYVDLIEKHGGIPFLKGNVPMMMRITESVNWIYGRVQNPWNTSRTAGGSSGGEAALLSSLSSPLGLGNDIGGSVRCPCSFNGLWGLRPTSARFTTQSNKMTTKSGKWFGNKIIYGVNGPMAKSVDDVVALSKVVLDQDCFETDSLVNWLPWNEELYTSKRKLRLGFIETCKEFPACQASRRAVREVAEIVRRLGHEAVDMNHFDMNDSVYTFAKGVTANDFIKSLYACLKGEKPLDEYKKQIMGAKIPPALLKLIMWWTNKNPHRQYRFFKSITNRTVKGFIEASKAVGDYRDRFQKLMNDNRLDGWIMPTNALPAVKHGHTGEIIMSAMYTMFFNLVDFPSGNVPATFVKETEQWYPESYEDKMTDVCKSSMRNSVGLPIGVQIAAPHNRDELVLNLMKQIEPHLQKIEYPLTPRAPPA